MTLALLGLIPTLLALLSGGSLTAANWAALENFALQLLTPENLQAALDFVKKHGPEVRAVIHDGAVWLETHNPDWVPSEAEPSPPMLMLNGGITLMQVTPDQSTLT